MNKQKLIFPLFLIATIAIAFAIGYGLGKLSASREIPTGANLIADVNLSIYETPYDTEQLVHIDWGNILPTQEKTFIIYIKNEAAIPLNISISTQDWSPSWAEGNLTFAYTPQVGQWVKEGYDYPILAPHHRAALILTLVAGIDSPSGAFSFTIVIRGDSL